jgi:hypothetical protein
VLVTGGNEKRPDWLAIFHATAMPDREISYENQRRALMRSPNPARHRFPLKVHTLGTQFVRTLANQTGLSESSICSFLSFRNSRHLSDLTQSRGTAPADITSPVKRTGGRDSRAGKAGKISG